MAKTGKIENNNKRARLVARYAEKRAKLKATVRDMSLSEEERHQAREKLQLLPKDANPNRQRNRCLITGRPRGNYRKFGICRVTFRELALLGEIPGVRKASW